MTKEYPLERLIEFEGNWYRSMRRDEEIARPFRMLINLSSDYSFVGVTLDEHGIARVKGKFEGDYIEFTKKYSKKAVEEGALSEILYHGSKNSEGFFVGGWINTAFLDNQDSGFKVALQAWDLHEKKPDRMHLI